MSFLIDTVIPLIIIAFLISAIALPEILKGVWMALGPNDEHSITKGKKK